MTPDILDLTDALPAAQQGMIGRQAMEIIDGVLAADSECDETIRQELRHQLAASPGRPDLALLEHVLAVRGGEAAGRADELPAAERLRAVVRSIVRKHRKDMTLPGPGLGDSAGGWQTGAMLAPYVHQATLMMSSETDLDAPGAAVTLGLCGSLDHTPPCPLPHHTHADRTGTTVTVRVVFATEPATEEDVRRRIDAALSAGVVTGPAGTPIRWEFDSSMAAELSHSEDALARRLAGA